MRDSRAMRCAAALAAAGLLVGCGAQGDGKDRPAAAEARAPEPREHVLGEFGGDEPEIAEADAICKSLGQRSSPDGSAAGAVSMKRSSKCDPVALYYGIGGPADPVRARQCAQALVDSGDGDPGLYGNGVLINVYANGKGGPRDLDRALRYACDDGMASGFDRATRVKKLAILKAAGPQRAAYDYCDDASSDYAVGQCMDVRIGLGDDARAREYAMYSRVWTKEQKAALAALRRAENAFAEARGEHETDMGGTERFVTVRGAIEDVHISTYTLFHDAVYEKLGDGSPDGAAAADTSLNATYAEVLKSDELSTQNDGGVTKGGVRHTQRAWVKYRDAWLKLARLTWPNKADALATKLTDARTQQLKCVPDPFDDAC